ncbi:KDPG/KHG aldolase [Dillenia turbinata]|uniref:KDPG/KHG aldolase n=1 Tax=Dillenia turbinata TaxID=194707 RepID=A0AAN8VHA1_9MAGN
MGGVVGGSSVSVSVLGLGSFGEKSANSAIPRRRCTSFIAKAASSVDQTLSQIRNSGVIACLRANSAEVALEAARVALSGGISVVSHFDVFFSFYGFKLFEFLVFSLEIVASTPGVFEVIQQLVEEWPATALGVGTVLNVTDGKKAINAGAKFLMSPVFVKEILNDVRESKVLYIPGAMTPTEIFNAYSAGAKLVKVYPVSALGGTQYIKALSKPLSHIPMVASQGIRLDLIGEYIARGASAVVLSDAIFNKEALAQRNYDVIHRLAHLATLQGNEAAKW